MNVGNRITIKHVSIDTLSPQFPDMHGTVIVGQGDQTLWHQSFSANKNIATDKNAQYLIASVTKNFTSAAILKLLFTHFKEDLRHALDTPLSDFLPPSHPIWKGTIPNFAKIVNIHHLLSHTSGIESLDKPLLYTPGDRYHYSNLGYILLGHVIQALINEPIEVYYKKVLFDPAGMEDTFFVTEGTLESLKNIPEFQKLVPGFEKSGHEIKRIKDKPDLSQLFTAGGIISTARDLIKWNYALYQGKVIPWDVLGLMTTPVIQKQGFSFYDGTSPLFSGYGIDIANGSTTTLYQHCGGTSGYQSKMSYDPKTQIGIVNLSNLSEDNPSIFAFTNKLREILTQGVTVLKAAS